MAPDKDRYKDIVLNPCNRTVERRNTAAIRDALEALAEEEADETTSEGSGDSFIFFEVAADNVGGDSVAVTELVYNGGSGNWEATGSSYTAYDWTSTGRWKNNFVTGYRGLGRLATAVASDALEIASLEGKARLIQGTLAEDMGQTTTKQALTDVTQYWGNDPNGQDPGAQVTIYDETNMAPNAKQNDVVLAIWDEKRQQYIMIAPWNGNQTPGTTAIVRCDAGDASKGCDSSAEEDDACLYSGKLQALSLGGNFCNEKFTDGASIWIMDARNCHANGRLGQDERYIAVSAGTTFDPDPMGPGTDERALYLVVDYAPSFRWFRLLTDAEAVAAEDDDNDLKCRQTLCGAVLQDDDAPSVFGIWEDIDPCTRELEVLDSTTVRIYFPMHRDLCEDNANQDEEEKCKKGDRDPDCRKNKHVLAFWNPLAERWDAVADLPECQQEQDVGYVYVCDGVMDPSCCVFDALKIEFYPFSDSYCDPVKKFEPIWLKCNTSVDTIDRGFCDLAVRICDSFECNGESRPVYLAKCTNCSDCECPEEAVGAHVRTVVDKGSDCGYLDNIRAKMYCVDNTNPFSGAAGQDGFAGILTFQGLMPRTLFRVGHPDDPPYTNNEVYLEIAGYGDPTHNPGDIINAFVEGAGADDFDAVAIPAPNSYDTGLLGCEPYTVNGISQWRIANFAYGVWFECIPGTPTFQNAQLYWLDPNYSTALVDRCDSLTQVPVFSGDPLGGPEDLKIEDGDCCANRIVGCPIDLAISCDITNPATTLSLSWLGGASLDLCDLEGGTHYFGGCPCAVLVPGDPRCNQNITACAGDNQVCFEFWWE